MWNTSLFSIYNRFHWTKNKFGPLNDHMIKECSWVATIVIGHSHHCHLAVTCPVTVPTVKTIVIGGCSPYLITKRIHFIVCITNSCSYVSHDLFTDLTAWDATIRTFLPSACVITWLCTDSSLQDCYIALMITSNHPTHSNTGAITVTGSSCTHSFPHNDPMHGFGDECVQYYSPPQSCARV